MPVIEDSIEIDRPRGDVFTFMNDPANILLVNSSLIEYEQVGEEPRGKGTHDRGVITVVGKRIRFVQEVTEWEPDEHIVLRSVEAPMHLEWTIDYRFEDHGEGGTRLTFRQETPTLGGVWGKLGDNLVLKMYAKDVRATLESTKALLEGG